jgi:hypothetical protein
MYALGAERSNENRTQGEVLLKTPTAQLAINGGSQHPDKRKAGGHGPTLADEVEHLFPTPKASDGAKGGPNQRGSKGDLTISSAVHRLTGATTNPLSADGNTSSEGWPLPQPLPMDETEPTDSLPDSSNG